MNRKAGDLHIREMPSHTDLHRKHTPKSKRFWWGKFKKIGGKMLMIWIGPMTEAEMKEYDDTFRHMSASYPLKDGKISYE